MSDRRRRFVAGSMVALRNMAEFEDAALLRFKLRALVDAFDAQRKRPMRKNEIEITVRLAGEPTAVVDALANGLPRAALEALRDRMCAAVIERQKKPAGRRRVAIAIRQVDDSGMHRRFYKATGKRKDRTR